MANLRSLCLCAQAAWGGHDSGMEAEALPSLPVAKGYSASLLQEQHQLYPGQAGGSPSWLSGPPGLLA